MTMQRDARFIPVKQDRDEDEGPDEAYLMAAGPANTYTLGTGTKDTEATAFLKDSGSSVFVLDDDIAEEDRRLYLLDANLVIA